MKLKINYAIIPKIALLRCQNSKSFERSGYALKLKAAVLIIMALLMTTVFPMQAFAVAPGTGSDSTAAPADSTTTKTPTSATTYPVSTSPEASLGSVTFKSSNSTRIEVGKSTTLYITIKDMPGSETTTFACSNTTVASIEKINNTCVKVYGLKDGEVVISATVGGKTAKYGLIIGAVQSQGAVGGVTTTQTMNGNIEIDMSNLGSDQLSQYIAQNQKNSATGIIIGIIGWTFIISTFGMVLSVIFRNRTPKYNTYPGSRARFNNGSYTGKQKKRLLPDHYYRSIRKY